MSAHPPQVTPKVVSAAPIAILCLLGLSVTLLVSFPGWMSADSLDQYNQARTGDFVDRHPVLMAWWWSQLLRLYDGPALMLIQNVALYWIGWGLVAMGMRRHVGRVAYLIPFVGFLPGLLFPLGMVWKDIFFACLVFVALAILFNAHQALRRPTWWERILVLVLAVFAIGVKNNGLTAIPFLMWYWVYVEQIVHRRWLLQAVLAGILTLVSLGIGTIAMSTVSVKHQPNHQGIQLYDLVGISVRTDQVLVPPFVSDALGSDVKDLARYYIAERANPLYWNDEGVWYATYTYDPVLLADMGRRWVDAILSHPVEYLEHRLDHFAAALRLGGRGPAYVAVPTIDPNPFGFEFTPNPVSDFLASTWGRYPWMYLSWLYAVVLVASMLVLIVLRRHVAFTVAVGGSAAAFVAPQFFVVPADDYRYFYFAYVCAVVLATVAVLESALAARARAAPVAVRVDQRTRSRLRHELDVAVGLFLLWRDNGTPRRSPQNPGERLGDLEDAPKR